MKQILLSILAIAALLFASSCEDRLNISQHSVSDLDNYYQTDDEAEEGLMAIYGQIRSTYSGATGLLGLTEFINDDNWSGGGSHNDGNYYMLGDYTFGTEYGAFNSLFKNLYTLIYRSNVVIERVQGESSIMKRAVAEAKVFRAFANFQLVSLWGTAPLVDHVLNSDEWLQTNSTPEALWAFVEQDLNDAINSGNLCQKSSATEKNVRITKQYAQALLGKALIFQKKYAEAAKLFDSVISSNLYVLESDLSSIGIPAGNRSDESLFEINSYFDRNVSANSTGGFWFGLRGEKYDYTDSAPFINNSFGFLNPTKDVYDDFVAVEGVDGYRLKNSIVTVDQMRDIYGTSVNSAFVITDNEGYWNFKHRVLKTDFVPYFHANNIKVMRLAEVYLLAAEAHFNSGNASKALEYLNVVRTRARAPLASSIDMDVIKRESRIELFREGHRYQNLIRWGDAAERLKNKGVRNPVLHPDGTVTWESYNDAANCGFKTGKHELFPIPSAEILSNPNIVQNQGW